MKEETCRFCETCLDATFIDLGKTPLSNSYLPIGQQESEEIFYPLHVKICKNCLLVQLPVFELPENIFNNYAYFSSYVGTLLLHSEQYTNMMINRFNITTEWQVIEIASNDGYLLQYFKKRGIPILGIEPANNVADVARENNIPTESFFLGKNSAEQLRAKGKKADLLIANNVLAHVPDLNDFVAGLKILLAPKGILTIEFPHILKLIEHNQFDTIYHEHFSYFSLLSIEKIFAKHKLSLFDVEEISTHGGSLRIYLKHEDDDTKEASARVQELFAKEKQFGLHYIPTYQIFAKNILKFKNELTALFTDIKNKGKVIAGYGAPAKATTLLHYCNIDVNLLPFTVDRSPHKQNKYLPGTKIPILHPNKIVEEKPDYIFVLPWNLKKEITEQLNFIKDWNAQFVIPIPRLEIM